MQLMRLIQIFSLFFFCKSKLEQLFPLSLSLISHKKQKNIITFVAIQKSKKLQKNSRTSPQNCMTRGMRTSTPFVLFNLRLLCMLSLQERERQNNFLLLLRFLPFERPGGSSFPPQKDVHREVQGRQPECGVRGGRDPVGVQVRDHRGRSREGQGFWFLPVDRQAQDRRLRVQDRCPCPQIRVRDPFPSPTLNWVVVVLPFRFLKVAPFYFYRVMLVGWGGNNGCTLTGGVIANRELVFFFND